MRLCILLTLPLLLSVTTVDGRGIDDFFPSDNSSGNSSANSSTGTPLDTSDPKQVERSRRWTDTLVQTYATHLKSNDWVVRALSIISYSRIDDPRTTEKLLELLKKDKHPGVRLYAWVGLWERNEKLTPEQRNEWYLAGLKLATRDNVMNGRMRIGMLKAMAVMGPTTENVRYFSRVWGECNLLCPKDVPVLAQLGQTLASWRCIEAKQLVTGLIRALPNASTAYKAEYVLRSLGVPGAGTCDTVHAPGTDLKTEWTKVASQYTAWMNSQRWAPFKRPKIPFEEPVDKIGLAPCPELINPEDPKWKKELELPRIDVGSLYLCVVLDSTGSMQAAIDWMRLGVYTILGAMKGVCREPSIGLTAYRDKGDAFVTRIAPLSSSGKPAGALLASLNADGGGDFPEAVSQAIVDTATKQRFPRGKNAKKIIILVADAPPHRENYEQLKQYVRKLHDEEGFTIYCMKVNNRIELAKAKKSAGGDQILDTDQVFDELAQIGGGKSFDVDFSSTGATTMIPGKPAPVPSANDNEPSIYNILVGTLVRDLINAEFHDRVDPFVNILLESLDRSHEEKRKFKPAPIPKPPKPPKPPRIKKPKPPGGGGGGQKPRPPRPPKPPKPPKPKPEYKQ